MNIGLLLVCLLACVSSGYSTRWTWPERAEESVRIDSKVRFIDRDTKHDDSVYKESRDHPHHLDHHGHGLSNYENGLFQKRSGAFTWDADLLHFNGYNGEQGILSDGTVDSMKYCKCVSTPDCIPRNDYPNACGPAKILCCYDRNNQPAHQNDIFSDQQPMFRPGNQREKLLVGPEGATGIIGPKPVLVGPGGPTGTIGPVNHNSDALFGPKGPQNLISEEGHILVGPSGASGTIGPVANKPVLVGPGGPTGIIGPDKHQHDKHNHHHHHNAAVLVGPEGPTGHIGPVVQHTQNQETLGSILNQKQLAEASAQRGILVGPGGPTGMIGPGGRRVLVGPGGPTGIIGPGGNRGILTGPAGPTGITRNRGILTGPGGPTGIIGPGYGNRGILTGPGGPTGIIGPAGYGFYRGQRTIVGPRYSGNSRGVLVGPGGPTGIVGPRS